MAKAESKIQKFERLAQKRMTEALRQLRLVGNLSNRANYDYSDGHVKQMLDALESEIKQLKNRFRQEDASGGQTWLWVAGNVINVLVFIVKGWVLVFVMMWVRWTLPRLRIDQVMMTCLRYLLPLSCVLLLGVSVWELATTEWQWLDYTRFVLSVVCLALFVWMIVKAIQSIGTTPTEMMPGAWHGGHPATPVGAGKP